MLDHTLVLVVNELGSPNHDPMDYPMILAGGGSAWSTGRYLFYPKDRTIHGRLRDYLMGPSHQHVLVSVAQAFGLDVNAVGETELPGPDGSVVNTEGPLAGLL